LLFEDVALLIGVALAHSNPALLTPLFIGLYVGILLGDVLLYAAGRWLKDVGYVRRWMEKGGIATKTETVRKNFLPMLIVCRAIPATRLPTLVTAGLLRYNLPVFILVIATSVLFWVSAILLGGINLVTYMEMVLGFSSLWLLPFVAMLSLLPLFFKRRSKIA
jgi:membrane protein DedA with SNARE-associated domain